MRKLRSGLGQTTRSGLTLPDHPGQIAAQADSRLYLAVRVTEEPDVVHADAFGRRGLLRPAQWGHLGARERLVESARVTVGDNAVDNVDAAARPERDRPRGAEVQVVGVRRDGEHPADLRVVSHIRDPTEPR